MITLYQPAGAWGISSVSPFCVKLETWLRIAGLPYEAKAANPMSAPKGKVPYIELEGRKMGDSQLIVEHLTERFGVTLDAALSPEQRAQGHVVRRMLEEATYWVLVHDRWAVEAGYAHTRPAFLAMMPPVVGGPMVSMIRRDITGSLRAQGTGRHTDAEIDAIGIADVDALATLLGDRPFFHGDAPTSVDATVYAFVASMLGFAGEGPTRAAALARPNLVAYRARMEERFWRSTG